jgi:hypothetical protein
MKNTITICHQITQIHITFCYTNKAYRKYLKKCHNITDESIEYGGKCTRLEREGKTHLVIGINEYHDIYAIKAIIVHELSHATTMLMNHSNIYDDEYRSYTLQWMYLEFMPFFDNIIPKD